MANCTNAPSNLLKFKELNDGKAEQVHLGAEHFAGEKEDTEQGER